MKALEDAINGRDAEALGRRLRGNGELTLRS